MEFLQRRLNEVFVVRARVRIPPKATPIAMRWTGTLIPTLRKPPEGAEAPSHVLMLRAGLVAQVTGGAFAFLPLGLRVLRKAEGLVRREMDALGAVEWAMPASTPVSLWQRSGRTEDFGDELIQAILPRQGRKVRLALAPAHEEVVADLVARHVASYRQLPITLYQVQTKFRAEARPRFGLLRTDEFLTSDAYSFHRACEELEGTYEAILAAYRRILDRAGLDYLVAEAESGPVGGHESHELVVPAPTGEQLIAHCPACGYTASRERAEIGPLGGEPSEVSPEPIHQVDTPGATTIEQVSALLGCRPQEMIKTLIYTTAERPIAVLIRGDHEANEAKIRRATGAARLELAPPDVIQRVTGAPVGFAGPVGLQEEIPMWADRGVQGMPTAVTGANRADAHLTGVRPARDFPAVRFADLRLVCDGDPCPRCSSVLGLRRAIEVGHLFKPGTRYSEALGARFADEHEQLRPIVMGSYQLGIHRLVAAVVEIRHDARGIVWPVVLAPYEVLLMPLDVTQTDTLATAEHLYDDLARAGIEVLLDDRDQRAGVKFHDADLVGVPLRVVLGPRRVKEGKLEIKWRWEAEPEVIEIEGAAGHVAELLRQERETGARFRAWQTSTNEGDAS
jgi:prolyl-tRNA synthetase